MTDNDVSLRQWIKVRDRIIRQRGAISPWRHRPQANLVAATGDSAQKVPCLPARSLSILGSPVANWRCRGCKFFRKRASLLPPRVFLTNCRSSQAGLFPASAGLHLDSRRFEYRQGHSFSVELAIVVRPLSSPAAISISVLLEFLRRRKTSSKYASRAPFEEATRQ